MGESGSSGCCAECRAALLEHVGDTEDGKEKTPPQYNEKHKHLQIPKNCENSF